MLEGEYKMKKKIMLSTISNFIGASRGRRGPVDVPCITQYYSSHPEAPQPCRHAFTQLSDFRLIGKDPDAGKD